MKLMLFSSLTCTCSICFVGTLHCYIAIYSILNFFLCYIVEGNSYYDILTMMGIYNDSHKKKLYNSGISIIFC